MIKLNRNIVISSVVISALAWLYTMFMYNKLPDKIVGHMNLTGDVNRYDDKYVIWVVLLLLSALIYGIYWMSNKTLKYTNNKRIDPQKNKTASLMTMPFIALIQFFVTFLIIHKSLYSNYNGTWFAYFIGGVTLIYLIIIFTFIYKNTTS